MILLKNINNIENEDIKDEYKELIKEKKIVCHHDNNNILFFYDEEKNNILVYPKFKILYSLDGIIFNSFSQIKLYLLELEEDLKNFNNIDVLIKNYLYYMTKAKHKESNNKFKIIMNKYNIQKFCIL
jgi:hypothetical protein